MIAWNILYFCYTWPWPTVGMTFFFVFQQVMLGDLPDDFLRVHSNPQQQQMAEDARIAQILQAQQQAGYVCQPSNITGKLSITVVQVGTSHITFVSLCQSHSSLLLSDEAHVQKRVLCNVEPEKSFSVYMYFDFFFGRGGGFILFRIFVPHLSLALETLTGTHPQTIKPENIVILLCDIMLPIKLQVKYEHNDVRTFSFPELLSIV